MRALNVPASRATDSIPAARALNVNVTLSGGEAGVECAIPRGPHLLASLLVFLAIACNRPAVVDATPPPIKPASNPFITASTDGGTGSLSIEVTVVGDLAPVPQLKRGADPACTGGETADESIVSTNGALANVVLQFVGDSAPAGPLPSPTVRLDQNKCTYVPHVIAAVVGQSLDVTSSDPTLHNVHAKTARGDSWFNAAQPPGSAQVRRPLSITGAFRVGCDVHPWMSAWVVVADSPFFAVTDRDGRARLDSVPVGHWRLRAWHERLGSSEQEVTVTPSGDAGLVRFQFAAGRK